MSQAIPRKIYLTDGNGAERPFIRLTLSDGQTGVKSVSWEPGSHRFLASLAGLFFVECLSGQIVQVSVCYRGKKTLAIKLIVQNIQNGGQRGCNQNT
jgi:hypothetical protein